MAFDNENVSEWTNLTCFNDSTTHQRELDMIPVAAVSSVLSILGSLLIMVTYLSWKDMRQSVPRTIVFWLAVADLLSAVGYLAASIFHLSNRGAPSYSGLCTFFSTWTTYFPKAAYLWTVFLAVYFVVVLILRKGQWARKLMFVFHLTAWLLPMTFVVPMAATGWLGRAEYSQGPTWCFVSDYNFINKSILDFRGEMDLYLTIDGLAARMWEILASVAILFCYLLIFSLNRCRWRMVSS